MRFRRSVTVILPPITWDIDRFSGFSGGFRAGTSLIQTGKFPVLPPITWDIPVSLLRFFHASSASNTAGHPVLSGFSSLQYHGTSSFAPPPTNRDADSNKSGHTCNSNGQYLQYGGTYPIEKSRISPLFPALSGFSAFCCKYL